MCLGVDFSGVDTVRGFVSFAKFRMLKPLHLWVLFQGHHESSFITLPRGPGQTGRLALSVLRWFGFPGWGIVIIPSSSSLVCFSMRLILLLWPPVEFSVSSLYFSMAALPFSSPQLLCHY